MNQLTKLSICLIGTLPLVATAQQQPTETIGPVAGERELSISGSGTSDDDFDNTSFSIVGEMGWYHNETLSWGIRQSINYADIEGEGITDDFWNGATRGYVNQHFGADRFRPFVGASLGVIYGDGVNDSGFAGLELGQKYYVLPSTYFLARVEYQWFFDSGDEIDDNFSDGALVYTFGIGYNF